MGLWLHVGQLRGRSWEGVQAPKLPPESDLPGLPTGKLLESFQIVTTFQLVKGFFQLVSFQLVKIRIHCTCTQINARGVCKEIGEVGGKKCEWNILENCKEAVVRDKNVPNQWAPT